MTRLLIIFLALAVYFQPHGADAIELNRGVGLHEWLNWSPVTRDKAYVWPPYRSVDDWLSSSRPIGDWPKGDPFVRIRSLGFDFVRLTVDPGPLLASKGARRQQALAILSKAVSRLTAARLSVVFNLHSVSQVPAYGMDVINDSATSEHISAYRGMVKDVAGMLVKLGTDRVAFEPFNEPAHYPCDASGTGDWQRIMADTVRDIRSVDRSLTIIATGACGGSITGLTNIDPTFDDANILYSFHMYDPHSFTHQRSDLPEGFHSGFPWPAETGSPDTVISSLRRYMATAGLSEREQQAGIDRLAPDIADYFEEKPGVASMKARIGEVLTWAKAHHIPTSRLFMGEFGVIRLSLDGRSGAYDVDRLRYLQEVRRQAEANGIPWSIWEYSNPYGMTVIEPKGPAVPDEGLLEALGLPPSRQ